MSGVYVKKQKLDGSANTSEPMELHSDTFHLSTEQFHNSHVFDSHGNGWHSNPFSYSSFNQSSHLLTQDRYFATGQARHAFQGGAAASHTSSSSHQQEYSFENNHLQSKHDTHVSTRSSKLSTKRINISDNLLD